MLCQFLASLSALGIWQLLSPSFLLNNERAYEVTE
jgi:hypothetical protein